jgi:hypothetical protein
MKNLILTAIVAVASALSASAQKTASATNPNNVISACVGIDSGIVKVVPDSTGCLKSSETFLQWNQQGVPGAAGATGPQGLPGLQGLPGIQGVPGPSGATGPAGAIGAIGPAGAPGSAGPTGPAGSTGPAGAIGPAGGIGPMGPSGPTGPTGAQGANGGQVWSANLSLPQVTLTDPRATYPTLFALPVGSSSMAVSVSPYQTIVPSKLLLSVPNSCVAGNFSAAILDPPSFDLETGRFVPAFFSFDVSVVTASFVDPPTITPSNLPGFQPNVGKGVGANCAATLASPMTTCTPGTPSTFNFTQGQLITIVVQPLAPSIWVDAQLFVTFTCN